MMFNNSMFYLILFIVFIDYFPHFRTNKKIDPRLQSDRVRSSSFGGNQSVPSLLSVARRFSQNFGFDKTGENLHNLMTWRSLIKAGGAQRHGLMVYGQTITNEKFFLCSSCLILI